MNDIAGPRVPYDSMHCGETGLVSIDLTRWNEPVHALLVNRWTRGAQARGSETSLARGTLIMSQGVYVSLYLQFPFNSIAAFAAAGLPAGYHYPCAWLDSPETIEPGVRPMKVRLVFYCHPLYFPAERGFTLYDHNLAGLPNPD